MNALTARQALLSVRSLVASGWTQGAYCRLPNGMLLDPQSRLHDQESRQIHYCLAGAIDRVCSVLSLSPDELRAIVERQIPPTQLGPRDGFTIERWNDRYERELDDVLDLLDAAIDSERLEVLA